MMTPVDRLSSIAGAATLDGGMARDADGVARAMMGAIGERLEAWAGVMSGGGARAGSFRPDAGELARRGDVYELRSLVAEAAARFGAGPAAEGALLRATEDFTRAAALHVYGGNGAAVADALTRTEGGGDGIDGVVDRLQAAMRTLRATAGQ